MEFVSTTAVRETPSKGVTRLTVYARPIAYDDGGVLKAISTTFTSKTLGSFESTAAPFTTTVTKEGGRRICPTRDERVYIEIGSPVTGEARDPLPVADVTSATAANELKSTNTDYELRVINAGHYLAWELELLNGWTPKDGLLSFPLILSGVTLEKDGTLLVDGKPAGRLRSPIVYDADNPENVAPIEWSVDKDFLVYRLPDTSGMRRPTVDPTYESQPDATAGVDTYINAGANASKNYGLTINFFAGKTSTVYRSLLAFDLSSIPAGQTLTSALLVLRVNYDYSGAGTSYDYGCHRALTQWYEGEKDGAAPDANQDGSTWNLRNTNGSVAWAGGAGGASGSDWTASATHTEAVTVAGFYTWDVLTDCQAWYGGTSNYGWWVLCTDESTTNSAKRFSSSDNSTAGNRPKLTIEYEAAATGTILTSTANIHGNKGWKGNTRGNKQ